MARYSAPNWSQVNVDDRAGMYALAQSADMLSRGFKDIGSVGNNYQEASKANALLERDKRSLALANQLRNVEGVDQARAAIASIDPEGWYDTAVINNASEQGLQRGTNLTTSKNTAEALGKIQGARDANALSKALEFMSQSGPYIDTNTTGAAVRGQNTLFESQFDRAQRIADNKAARAIQAGQLQVQRDDYSRKIAEDAYRKEQDRLFKQSLLSSATDTSGTNLTGATSNNVNATSTGNTSSVGNNPILSTITDSFNLLKNKDGGYSTQDVTATAAQLKQGIENAAMDEAKRQAVASGVSGDKLPSLIDNLYKRNLAKYTPELTAVATAEKDFTGQLESSRKVQLEKNKKAEEAEIAGSTALEEALNKQFTRSPGITEFRSTVQEQANTVTDTVGILSNIKDPSGRRVFDNKVLAKAVDSYKGDINDMEGFVQTLKSSLTTNKNLDPATQYALNNRFDALLGKGSALKDITPEQVISEFKDALLKDSQGFLVDVPDDVRQSYIKKYQGLVPNKLPSRNQNKE